MQSRRIFLKNGAFAFVTLGFAPAFLTRTAFAAREGSRRKLLIAIFQRGAVDGLSVVVPFGAREYYRARPTIAIPLPRSTDGSAIDLDGFFGLHPRLAALEPLWQRRELAIVHACGSPDNTRSHFDAQDYMETATPGVKNTSEGWLNRYLQARRDDGATPFRAVALGEQMPRSLQGRADALAIPQLARFGIRGGAATGPLSARFEEAYGAAPDRALNSTGRETFEAIKMLGSADPAAYLPEHGAEYPRSPLGQALRQIAQLTKANLGLEVAFTDVGGWDTHVSQGGPQGQLAGRLDDFAHAIAALTLDLGDRMEDIVVLTMSEFGRAVNENGNHGTDHGHGNAMLVVGGGVHGGRVYGRWPGLAPEQLYEGRDLAVTTDFRDVFGEIVVRHLGMQDASPIFPGYKVESSRFPGVFA